MTEIGENLPDFIIRKVGSPLRSDKEFFNNYSPWV